jgi:acetolactate synthase-1/2/3 large subunit
MKMNVADYIVDFLIKKKVTDVFGYQGGMITYLFDALKKRSDEIQYHIPYNEQGAAFAANGYAQVTGKLGFAFVTSGPGFTNLLTGIANAFFDSVPTMFISAQVNWKDKRHGRPLRQLGFQEIDAPDIAKPVVKKSYDVEFGSEIVNVLNDAYFVAMSGRKGPVFLEIPINVFRDEVEVNVDEPKNSISTFEEVKAREILVEMSKAKRPLIIAGAGVNQCGQRDLFRTFVGQYRIPIVTTLPAVDLLPDSSELKFGYIGASGRRLPNLLLSESDFILSLGTRLSTRQVGHNLEKFAPKARLFRVDIDESEFTRKVKQNEVQVHSDIKSFLWYACNNTFEMAKAHNEWLLLATKIKTILDPFDKSNGNLFFEAITSILPNNANIILDVGKNEIWGAQSSVIKSETQLRLSAGLGSMGYSLPAAIGAYYGNHNPTYSFNGDGGIQMNIQELQTVSKNRIPLKIVVINNHALGMITLFQDQYFSSRYVADKESKGDYYSTDILKIGEAYGIDSFKIRNMKDISSFSSKLLDKTPSIFEFDISNDNEPILPGIPAGSPVLSSGEILPKKVICEIKDLLG